MAIGFHKIISLISDIKRDPSNGLLNPSTGAKGSRSVQDGRFCSLIFILISIVIYYFSPKVGASGTLGAFAGVTAIGFGCVGIATLYLSLVFPEGSALSLREKTSRIAVTIVPFVIAGAVLFGVRSCENNKNNAAAIPPQATPLTTASHAAAVFSPGADAPLASSSLSGTVDAVDEVVWVSSSGTKYHTNASCSNMSNPSSLSINDATDQGYTPCTKCDV